MHEVLPFPTTEKRTHSGLRCQVSRPWAKGAAAVKSRLVSLASQDAQHSQAAWVFTYLEN